MFKALPISIACLCVVPAALAQSFTTTPNLGLQIPAFNTPNWQVSLNANFINLDQMLSGKAALPGLHVSGALQVDGNLVAPNLSFTEQQIATAIGYTPLSPTRNLSDLSNPGQALATLGGLPAVVPTVWSNSTTYGQYALVIGSDGATYISTQAANTGNNPTATGSTFWGKFAGGASAAGSAGALQVAGTGGALAAASPSQVLAALPYTPLSPSNNLSDVASPATALSNLGAASSSALATTNTTASSALTLAQGALPAQTPAAYASGTTYAKNALATDASGDTFISLQAANTGNALPSPITTPTAFWALYQKVGSSTPLSPSGSVSGQLVASGGNGNPTVALTAAQQRASDNALMVLKSVTDNPRTDATSTSSAWFTGSGCANSADPTGKNGSSCAINAAIQYTVAQGRALSTNAQGQVPCVYLPNGNYLIDAPGLYQPTGACIISDGENTTLTPTPGTSYSVLTVGTVRGNNPGGIGQLSYPVVKGVKFLGGDTPTSTNTLLEVDTSGFIGEDLVFAQTAGVAFQQNLAERVTLMRPAFYNNRQAMGIAGDDNESFVFYPTGLANGELSGQAPSGSAYGNYSWCESCTAGKYPSAGTSSAPTLLYPNTHAAIEVQRAVEYHFVGGDMKSNGSAACFKFGAVSNGTVDGTYCESTPIFYPTPPNSPSVILGGQSTRTTLTGSITTATVNGQSVWEVNVANTAWFPMHYGSTLDIANGLTDYQPHVIMPPDYVAGSTTASAYCPGINQGQYEQINSVVTVGPTQAIFGVRNSNGVYNATSNATGVPASYAWGSCTSPATLEDATLAFNLSGNQIYLRGHFNSNENGFVPGTINNGYEWVNGLGVGPDTAEIAVGATPSNPADVPGPDFYTQNGATGDLAKNIPNDLWIGEPSQIFGNANNPYSGSIVVSHQAKIHLAGGQLNADADTFTDPYALSLDTTSPGLVNTEHVSIGSHLGFGNVIANPLAGNTAATEVQVSIPELNFLYENTKGVYWHDVSYFSPNNQSSSYISGLTYQNNFNLLSAPSTGQTKPQANFHCYGPPSNTASGCAFELFNYTTGSFAAALRVDLTSNKVTSAAPFYPTGGIVNSINAFTTAPAYTIPAGQEFVHYGTTGTITLPGMTAGGGFAVLTTQSPGSPVTFVAPTGLIQNQFGSLGSSFTETDPGTYEFKMDGANYQIISEPELVGIFPKVPNAALKYTGLQNSGGSGTLTVCTGNPANCGGGGVGTTALTYGVATPSLSGSALQAVFTATAATAYSSTATYSQYQVVSSGGVNYYSLINSNTGNTPASTVGTDWAVNNGYNGLTYRGLPCPSSGCAAFSNMVFAVSTYFPSTSTVQAFEYDPDVYTGTYENQASVQCDGKGTGNWRLWNMSGIPGTVASSLGTGGSGAWVTTPFSCANYFSSVNTWHTLKLWATFNTISNTYTYKSFSVDGVPIFANLNQTFSAVANTGTAKVNVQFQVDNTAAATSNTEYLDNWSNSVF